MQNSYPFNFSEAVYTILPNSEPIEQTYTGTVKLALDEDDEDEVLTIACNGIEVDFSKWPNNSLTKTFEALCLQSARDLDWAKKQAENI